MKTLQELLSLPRTKQNDYKINLQAKKTFPIIRQLADVRRVELEIYTSKKNGKIFYDRNRTNIKTTQAKIRAKNSKSPFHYDLAAILNHAFDPSGNIQIPIYNNRKTGYQFCSIHSKTYYVHRLIWMFYEGNIPKDRELNHIDGNKKNNDINNLELVTHQQNIAHASKMGLMKHRTIEQVRARNNAYVKAYKKAHPDKAKLYAQRAWAKKKSQKIDRIKEFDQTAFLKGLDQINQSLEAGAKKSQDQAKTLRPK